MQLYILTGRENYKKAFSRMLHSLSSKKYLSSDVDDYEGIIMHACADKRAGEYTNSSLIFGCYSYVEALSRLPGMQI